MARSQTNGVATFAAGALAASVTFVVFAFMPKPVAVTLAIWTVGLVGALLWKKKLRGQWLGVALWIAGGAGLAGMMVVAGSAKPPHKTKHPNSPHRRLGKVVKPKMVTIRNDSPPAHLLAVLDNRGERRLTKTTVSKYERAMASADAECRETPRQIADFCVAGVKGLTRRGHDISLLEFLQSTAKATGRKQMDIDCAGLTSGMVRLAKP